MKTHSANIQTVLTILKDEVDGNIPNALSKMSADYTQTWMYQKQDGTLFPSETSITDDSMQEIYTIKGREYHIYNITESENTVMVECIEQYPDETTGQLYRTPQVLIVEFKNGKINRGRHYCDPRLSYLELTDGAIASAYKNIEPILVIK